MSELRPLAAVALADDVSSSRALLVTAVLLRKLLVRCVGPLTYRFEAPIQLRGAALALHLFCFPSEGSQSLLYPEACLSAVPAIAQSLAQGLPLPSSLKIHLFCFLSAICSMVRILRDGSGGAPWEKSPPAVPLCSRGGLRAEFVLGGCLEPGVYCFLKQSECAVCCAEVESASAKCEKRVGAHPCRCRVCLGRGFRTWKRAQHPPGRIICPHFNGARSMLPISPMQAELFTVSLCLSFPDL